MTSPTALVVGSSIAGVRTAQALRSNGYTGRVIVLGEEGEWPYDKPPLSKGFLTGETEEQRLALVSKEEAAKSSIEFRLGSRAERLDPAGREVHLDSGEAVAYDHLVIATGARAHRSPWSAEGLHVLRTLEDSRRIREDLVPGGSLVVIGAGFIGSEVASSAREMGMQVTLVDSLAVPMARATGEEAGAILTGLHSRHGASTHFGAGVESVEGERGALEVRLTDGTALQASVVVVGIGARPNDEWLESSGLSIENGVVCDEYCRAAGAEGVYAAGDVARWFHPRHRQDVRVEHWTNAAEQASVVAYNICHPDEPRPYQPVEYVWSDQYDWKIQIAGRPGEGVSSVTVGDPGADRRFAVVCADSEGMLAGSVTVNWPRALIECRRRLAGESKFSDALDRLRAL